MDSRMRKRLEREQTMALDALLKVANADPEGDVPYDGPEIVKGIEVCQEQGFIDKRGHITAKGREAYKQARLEDLPVQRIRPDLTHNWAWQTGRGGTNECKACGLATKFQRGSGERRYLVEGTWVETCPVCTATLPLSPEHVALLRLIRDWTDAPGTETILGKEDRVRLIQLRQRDLVLAPQFGTRSPQIAPAGRTLLLTHEASPAQDPVALSVPLSAGGTEARLDGLAPREVAPCPRCQVKLSPVETVRWRCNVCNFVGSDDWVPHFTKRELADVLLEISARVLVDVVNLPLTRANAFDMITDAKNVGRLLRGTADRARAGITDFTREAQNAEAIAAGMEKQYGEARKVIVAAWRSAAVAMRGESA